MSAGGCEQRRDRMGIAFKEIALAVGWGLTGREREGAAPERPRPQHSPHSRLSDSAFNPHGGPGEAGAAVIGTAPTGK